MVAKDGKPRYVELVGHGMAGRVLRTRVHGHGKNRGYRSVLVDCSLKQDGSDVREWWEHCIRTMF
jgi:hypothetical protein